MRKVIIIDTSILCVYLKIPQMETCTLNGENWDFHKVNKHIEEEIAVSTTLVLPLATIIETGNHIARARIRRRELAENLAEIMTQAAEEKTPWAAFTHQSELWGAEGLKNLAAEWPDLAMQNISIGDATIKTVVDYYKSSFQVEIFTCDRVLKAYQPSPTTRVPRRRSG